MLDAQDLLRRFLSYVRIDTQSDPHSNSRPTSAKQWALVRQLESELQELDLGDVRVTETGCVMATLRAASPKARVARVALLAHVDTATNCSGAAKPIVHRDYRGGPIVLPDDPNLVLTTENTPLLAAKIGDDIITASGKSLLGADDKAGIAIIMAALRHLVRHPEIRHGTVRICFNPDEEVGHGAEHISLDELAADVAYTLDAQGVGTIDAETFSAEKAVVSVQGVASHPGWAKGVMVNALRLAADLVAWLPREVSPERTDGRDGFIHPDEIRGTAERVEIFFILRDFEMEGLAAKRRILEDAVDRLRAAEPRAVVSLEVTPEYRNMRYWLEKDSRPVEFAIEAIRRAGLTPRSESVRGGTDGSRLTERGLPTPNLFAGYHDIHSPREWVSLQDMVKAAETVIHLLGVWEERS